MRLLKKTLPNMTLPILLLLLTTVHGKSVERDTPSGRVRGYTQYEDNFDGSEMYLGIPYAEPPTRFRRSEPVRPWKGTRLATEQPPACPQTSDHPYPWYDSESSQDEDCLYLNVWTPDRFYDNYSWGVLVWIPGGEYFSQGSAAQPVYNFTEYTKNFYSGNEEDAIAVVVVNYRLGGLGFFTLGTEDAPGNVGLYDIVLALQWVQSHISSFGGDPTRVTIAGSGDGAVLASLLSVSSTPGLFRGAILHGGTFYLTRNRTLQDNVRVSRAVAEELGCSDGGDEGIVLDCMREKSSTEIANTVYKLSNYQDLAYFPHYGDGLIPDDPHYQLQYGDLSNISLVVGVTKEEGAYLLTRQYEFFFGIFGEESTGEIDESFASRMLRRFFAGYPDHDEMAEYYMQLESNSSIDRVLQAYTDTKFVCPMKYFADQFSRQRNVYFYFYTHQASKTYRPWADWMGVVHFQDVPFATGVVSRTDEDGSAIDQTNKGDVRVGNFNMVLWAAFTVEGKPHHSRNSRYPGVQWLKYTMEDPWYLSFEDSRGSHYYRGPREENCGFLRKYLE